MAKKDKVQPTAPVVVPAVAIAAIVAATLDVTKGFIFAPESVYKPLIEAGLVEINDSVKNEAGEIATRATQKGIDSVQNSVNETAAAPVAAFPVAPATKPVFVLRSNIPVPVIKRGGRTGDKYPFATMELNQSFFIPATVENPTPAKSLASTVASATARFAVPAVPAATRTTKKGKVVPVMVETRKFIVRSVTEEGVKGACIWRTK